MQPDIRLDLHDDGDQKQQGPVVTSKHVEMLGARTMLDSMYVKIKSNKNIHGLLIHQVLTTSTMYLSPKINVLSF